MATRRSTARVARVVRRGPRGKGPGNGHLAARPTQWGAGHGLHENGDRTIEAWVARTARTVLAGDSGKAAAAIRTAAEQAQIAVGQHKGIDDAVAYLTNKAAYLHYDTALTAGWPIATGIIEGAWCATRRAAVSPVQPGGTRRKVLGSDDLPGVER
jgi:hypothetical protein